MADLIKGKLSSRPINAPVGTLFWDEDTNITYVYDDAAWSIYPGSGRGNWATKAELDSAVDALTLRIAALEGAVKVSVSFNTDGGSEAPATQTVAYGDTATEPADPTKASKVFAGWYSRYSVTAWDFTTRVYTDLELTAHWVDAE